MRKSVSLLVMLLIVSSFMISCSFGSNNDAETETTSETTATETEKATDDNSAADGGADAASLGIELRDHNFDPADEEIEDEGEGPNYYLKSGNNLTLPDELPDHFPIPVGMTATSVKVQTKSADDDEFHSLEIWFDDGGNYELEDLNKLYQHYLEDSFTDVEVKDYSHFKDDLTVFIGYRDDLEFYIDSSPEPDYNIVTISIYTDF